MNTYFIILAAGKSKRFGAKLPKQFTFYKGKRIFEHSIDKATQSKLFKKIILVINKKDKKFINNSNKKKVVIIEGGNERKDSSLKALNYLRKFNPKNVFIHDAARPNISINLINKLNKYLKRNKAVIPYIKSENSVKLKIKNKINNFDRNKVYLTQTPQCFDFKSLYKLAKNNKSNITDDVSLFLNNNIQTKFIIGENRNFKITNLTDSKKITFKTNFGIGYDIHRLEPKRKLYLGGIKIPHHLGLKGHSDGDAIIHSLIDALLGACKLKDIGYLFSDKKSKFKNIRSTKMLDKVLKIIRRKNYYINNIDINLIAEKPKISKYRNKIIKSISKLCRITKNQINIKGKTTEKLGLIGKEKAIACEVIASVIIYD